jgi:hypothetical protein
MRDCIFLVADPGVFNRGHELLRPYERTHRFAVVGSTGLP